MRKNSIKYLVFTLSLNMLISSLAACGSPPKQESTPRTSSKTIHSFHYKKLQSIFATYEYDLKTPDRGVPPLILTKFPNDLHLIHSTRLKKELFFKSILPMALLANEEVIEHRNRLTAIFNRYDSTGQLTDAQQEQLSVLLKHYRIKSNPLTDAATRESLLARVDTVPESLILAQAANESGWGTSRFVRQANNIFGEWTFTPGTGLVPEGRPEGEIYEVRRFKNLYQSVRSYLRNINTHRAYASLREIRKKRRDTGSTVTGVELSAKLNNYSTRREEYSREIESMIRSNRLEQLTTSTYLRGDASIPGEKTVSQTTGLLSSKELLQNRAENL